MSRPATLAASTALIGAGVIAWAVAGPPLLNNAELDVPLNILGINRSPYGEVFAMAMQSSIDTTFHRGQTDDYGSDHDFTSKNSVEEARGETLPQNAPSPSGNLKARFGNFISSMASASIIRTNPRPTSRAHDFYIRRQVEDKLRFAYQLDPAHYGNYNSYHFFLTEPQMGTRPELTPGAAKLAEDTIRYCLAETRDPRPALTAAAAACNVLHLMFADKKSGQSRFTLAQMEQTLGLLDHCIARHFALAETWEKSGEKSLLSPMRLAEMETRISFVLKIRDAADATIQRFKNEQTDSLSSSGQNAHTP